ncbi:MAG: response regulator [Clostridia bacterium]|nr:response regulator [Clostridia bacterium]
MGEFDKHSIVEYMLTLLRSPSSVADKLTESDFIYLKTASEIKDFIDKLPGGFLIYRADGEEEIIYANDALINIFECENLDDFKSYVNNSFTGIVHPDDLQRVEDSIKEQISGSMFDLDYVEYRITSKKGDIRWIEDYGHFIENEKLGNVFYVFLCDATEKKQREIAEKTALINEKESKIKKLIEEYDKERKLINQEHLRRLEVIEGLSVNYDSILYADLDEDTVTPYRLSGRTQKQFDNKFRPRGFSWYVSNYIEYWVHPEDRSMIAKVTSPNYIREKLSSCKTYYVNYRCIKNGETQYLQLRVVNVGSDERVSQVVFGYRNVDEEIQREMHQKQVLEDALKNAKMSYIAKNTFLSNMSHDMRTPLNAIFGFAELAKNNLSDTAAIKNYVEKIETSARQILELIDKVLEVSYIESRDVCINESDCVLTDLVQEVYDAFAAPASQKDLKMTLKCDEIKNNKVCVDADKLKQVLMHLVGNAVRYTDKGRVDIVLTEKEKMPNDFVIYDFTVRDTGKGIGKEFIDRLFEPFERENDTTTSGVYGMGLGLTIAKNIVDLMGGNISVESQIDSGSAFTVTLGLRLVDSCDDCCRDTQSAISELIRGKILIVEDNEINLEIETEILQGLDFTVDSAENGKIAVDKLAAAKEGEYSVVLMDIQMPVMDGRKATEEIRKFKNKAIADIPIIALSANAFESDKRMSMEAGMDAHLTKPVDVPLLMETMADIAYMRKQKKVKHGNRK